MSESIKAYLESIGRIYIDAENDRYNLDMPCITWTVNGSEVIATMQLNGRELTNTLNLSEANLVGLGKMETVRALVPFVKSVVDYFRGQLFAGAEGKEIMLAQLQQAKPWVKWVARTVSKGELTDRPDFEGVVIRATQNISEDSSHYVDLCVSPAMVEWAITSGECKKIAELVGVAFANYIITNNLLPVRCEQPATEAA